MQNKEVKKKATLKVYLMAFHKVSLKESHKVNIKLKLKLQKICFVII